ncbi:MAG: phosphotransferase family protein [Proteobacteria bacterium]|nr:MAG: phosphotransferase family protein [Pseudomonadota bacterium]
MSTDNHTQLLTAIKQSLKCSDKAILVKLTGGVSNLTYRLTDGEHQWIVRTSPPGTKARGAHDMVREFNLLKALSGDYDLSPKVHFLIDDINIFPRPLYIMEAINGIEIHKNIPDIYSTHNHPQLCRSLIQAQYQLHQVPLSQELQVFNKGHGYIQRQVDGWIQRYRNVQAKHNRADLIIDWLLKQMPEDKRAYTLIHNDFKFDNLIFDAQNITTVKGVLDWEMATVGDPLMDLGCSLAYWIQADDSANLQAIRSQPTTEKNMLSRDDYVHQYCQISGLSLDNYDFYYVYGLFRLMVIVQQIYYRYEKGQTDDQRFKPFGQIRDILIQHSQQQIGDSHV